MRGDVGANIKKLELLGENQQYFTELMKDAGPIPKTQSQQRLLDGYKWIRRLVQDKGEREIIKWLDCIKKLEVLEFIESNEGKAIRMFQSVNDRGVPLSNMDKAKSLLIYYSNRFLVGELDQFINTKFGLCFKAYNRIKELSNEPGFKIKNIDRKEFTEDNILRYHYLAFDSSSFDPEVGFDYRATSDFVLNVFLKPILKKLRDKADVNGDPLLGKFIKGYVEDLAGFFSALEDLISGTRTDLNLFNLFVLQDLSAYMYPLVIRLQENGQLYENVSNNNPMSLLMLVEITDLRVYKVKGTDPSKDVFEISRRASNMTPAMVANQLRSFVSRFMDDSRFEAALSGVDVYGKPGLYRIMTEVESNLRGKKLSLDDLIELVKLEQSIEHVLPQDPDFGFPSFGFDSREDYELFKHRLGNLFLLESSLNKRCSNEPLAKKLSADNLYRESKYVMVQNLSAKGCNNLNFFNKTYIDQRSKELAKQAVGYWPIWAEEVIV